MTKIYVPTEYLNKPCYTINNGYIRVYDTINGNSNRIYDIYINQDYMIKEATANYSSNTQCVNPNLITDDIFYRTDFDSILIIFFILCFFIIYIPFKITIFRFIRR